LLGTNGLRDTNFQVRGAPPIPFFNSETREVLVQADGKILVITALTTTYPTQQPGQAAIGRLMPDGTWDNSFNLLLCDLSETTQVPGPFWFNNSALLRGLPLLPVPIARLVRQTNGVLVLAGIFKSINGEPRRRLARLDPDGAIRGQFRLAITPDQGPSVFVPPEIEAPYTVETSTDLEHWSAWVQNDYPWWSTNALVPRNSSTRFFRARFLPTALGP
jgi:hypothetical protein